MERSVWYEESRRFPSRSGVIKMVVHEPGDGCSVPLDGKHVELIGEVDFGLCGIGVDTVLTVPLVHCTRVAPVVCAVGNNHGNHAGISQSRSECCKPTHPPPTWTKPLSHPPGPGPSPAHLDQAPPPPTWTRPLPRPPGPGPSPAHLDQAPSPPTWTRPLPHPPGPGPSPNNAIVLILLVELFHYVYFTT